MKITALKFSLEEGALRVTAYELDAGSAQRFQNELQQEVPLVLALRNDHLDQLIEFKDLVVDRGWKHPAIQLSRIFLKPAKFPGKALALRTDYSVVARLRTSLKALLNKICKADDKIVCLVGVREEIFDELQKDCDAPRVSCSSKHKVSVDDFWSLIAPPPEPIATQLADKFVGVSAHAQRVRMLIYLATQVNATVLVLGETGTGKEVVARAIHDHDQRSDKGNFVPVNCSAIPENLFESELFGYVRGAFSDAKTDREGLWQSAKRGTLFLDEIGDLSLDNQVKVLRALEEKRIRRVGSDRETGIESVRVIAATNRDVHSMLVSGKFREDLYYRLIQFLIRTPSLREHTEDIPILAMHFWKDIGNGGIGNLTSDTLEALKVYSWPGNARQLRLVLMNLHSFFPSVSEIQVKYLKFVLHYLGALYFDGEFESDQESSLDAIKSLRNLRRVEEVLRMFSVKLHPLVELGETDERAVRSTQAWIEFRLSELQELCAQPSLFGKGPIFLAVHQLLGRMKYFNELLKSGYTEALAFWSKEVSKEFKGVSLELQSEIQRLLNQS